VAQAIWYQWCLVKTGDVVHIQFPVYFPLGLSFFLIAALKNCPIVFTVHDPRPHKSVWPGWLHPAEKWMSALAYKLSRRVIVHNEDGRDTLIREFQLDPGKLSIISHGPYEPANRRAPFPAFDSLRLLAFGSIRENKGLHLAIQAVQSINTRGGVRVHLTIAGSVANARERDYWSECRTLINREPGNINVIERYISEPEVEALVADHHAFLLPYLNFASDSGVASLALAHRRPILATNAGGLGTLLNECSCGILIPSPTVEGVATAIVTAIQAGARRLERMGSDGEIFFSSVRSWQDIAGKTAALYAELLEDHERSLTNENVSGKQVEARVE
jgi:glycosyltransferase involved in cell wall biosynthesis